MNRLIIIGTLHLGLTPKNELKRLLEDLHPTQLFLELPQDKAARSRAGQHSDEMEFADTWARTNSIQVNYFDSDLPTFRDEVSVEDPEYRQLENEQVDEIRGLSWQELNKKEPWEQGKLGSIEKKFWRKYIDPEKWENREKKMLENIQKFRQSEGTTVILTGAGHLGFFEKELPEAEFPFRN